MRGRLAWGDVRKPSLMSRDSNRPGRVVVLGGQGRCRCDAAGGGRGHIDDRVDTVIPGIQRAPNPSRVLRVWNVETPSGSGGLRCEPMHAGKPTVREAQSPGGNRMPKKRMPVAERQQEDGHDARSSNGVVRITGRIPGRVPGCESRLTCGR